MGKKKQTSYHDIYASSKTSDRFGTLFESMLISPQYNSLTLGARHFYTLCRVQSQTTEAKECLYNHASEEGTQYPPSAFVFPDKHLRKFGIQRSNACRYFRELEDHGFIKKLDSNAHRRKVNVYSFSAAWKD